MSTKAMSPFQKRLKTLMKEYVHYVYKLAKQFPREEQFDKAYKLADEIGAILWTEIKSLDKNTNKSILKAVLRC